MKMNLLLGCASLVGAILLGSREVSAQQGFGNFDPAQLQQQAEQRLMENYRTRLEITDDAEWQVIGPLIQKVVDAQREAGTGGSTAGNLGNLLSAFGGGQRGGQGGTRGGLASRLGVAAGPEAEALQKAIDEKAANADLKAALAKLAEARKLKQANLEKAQAELRQILSIRREAIATLAGLL